MIADFVRLGATVAVLAVCALVFVRADRQAGSGRSHRRMVALLRGTSVVTAAGQLAFVGLGFSVLVALIPTIALMGLIVLWARGGMDHADPAVPGLLAGARWSDREVVVGGSSFAVPEGWTPVSSDDAAARARLARGRPLSGERLLQHPVVILCGPDHDGVTPGVAVVGIVSAAEAQLMHDAAARFALPPEASEPATMGTAHWGRTTGSLGEVDVLRLVYPREQRDAVIDEGGSDWLWIAPRPGASIVVSASIPGAEGTAGGLEAALGALS